MSINNTVRGFFYISGSIDRPIGYNDNLKFGFKPDGSGPLFNYSLNSILDYYNNPINLSTLSQDVHKNNSVLNMIIEGYDYDNGVEFENISDENYAAKKLDKVFSILEYLYDNQDSIADVSSDPTVYTCKADEYFRINTLFEDSYEAGSISITKSPTVIDRVSHVSFIINYGVDVNNAIVNRVFEFYFTPDDMLLKYWSQFSKCTVLEDSDNFKYFDNTTIDPYEHFKDAPMSDVFNVEMSENYKNCMVFKTQHVIFNLDGTINRSVQQQFFIYTHMYKEFVANLYSQITIVKNYLNEKYNWDIPFLKKSYPDLFADSDIDIYPMISNVVNGKVVLPYSFVDIIAELDKRSIPTINLNEDSNNIEVFILEGVGKFDEDIIGNPRNGIFRIPIIAIDQSLSPTNKPIGSQFPRFSITTTGMVSTGSDWEVLHFYIMLFTKVLLNMVPGDFTNMTDDELSTNLNVPGVFSLKTEKFSLFDIQYLQSISFIFNGSTFKIHGYNYGVIHGIN